MMVGNRRRWLTSAIAVLLMVGLLAGCGSKPATNTPGTGGEKPETPTTFRYLTSAEPTTLDPALVTDSPSIMVVQNLFDPMVNFDVSGKIVPGLAKEWKASADGKVYTFTLHNNIKFHNGRTVTAADLKWSWERALNPDLKSSVSMLYLGDIVGAKAVNEGTTKELAGVKVVNDTTLEVTIDENRPYFLSKLTYMTSAAVPKEEVEKHGPKWIETAVGTGPFKLKEWVHNNKIVLERNDAWHLGKAKVNTVDLAIIKDEQTAWGMYQAGQLDAVGIPTADLKRTLADSALSKEYLGFANASTGYFAMNINVFEPFKDVRVRQAFNHAVDTDAFIKVALEDSYAKATGILPTTLPGNNPNVKPLGFNVAKAKQLMADAGYPDGKNFPKLTISVRAQRETTKKMAEFIQNQLKTNLGIDVAIQEVEWGVLLADLRAKNKVPAYVLSWGADYLDPENFLNILFRSDAGNNRTGYKNARVDELINIGNTALKWEDRLKAYHEAEQIILNEGAWVPLYYTKTHMLVKPHVKGLEYNAMGLMAFTKVSVEK